MLELHFNGWFQCRLATDPDPFDDPAGVSGKTLALAHEPPLDRVIRFHDAVAPRTHAPAPDVCVRAVRRDGVPLADHPLQGARVDLLGDAKFAGHNGLIADDGYEPIVPFRLRLAKAGIRLEREDPPPAWPPGRVPDPAAVQHRNGHGLETDDRASTEVCAAIGSPDLVVWYRHRAAALRRDGGGPRLQLLRELKLGLFVGRVRYEFTIGGHGGTLSGALPEAIDLRAGWPISFWMGAWDADGLCGFVDGTLSLPLEEPA